MSDEHSRGILEDNKELFHTGSYEQIRKQYLP